MSLFHRIPVTGQYIVVCVCLFVVCVMRTTEGVTFEEAQREWGAAVSQQVPVRTLGSDVAFQPAYGPLDLWAGQWWRIPISVFHHKDLVHLVINCILMRILGAQLERRWGSLRFLIFLIPAVFAPFVVEFAAGSVACGLSAVVCTIFGAQIALSQVDPKDTDFPQEITQLALGVILLGIPVSAMGLYDLPNLAHLTGILYGWFTAWTFCQAFAQAAWIRACFGVAHLIFVPAFWLAMHPVGSGGYLWYLGYVTQDPAQREHALQLAIETDPALSGVWLELANARLAAEKPLEGWSMILRGLSNNPSDIGLLDAARRLWLRLKPGHDRELADAELDRVFGAQGRTWSQSIRNLTAAATQPRPKPAESKIDPAEFPLDQPIELLNERKSPGISPLPPIDHDLPDSAVEGTSL